MKLKFLLIDERSNIPFSFSRIEKQFVVKERKENLDRSSLGRVIPLNALKLLYQRIPSPWNWIVAEVTVVGIFVFERHIKSKE